MNPTFFETAEKVLKTINPLINTSTSLSTGDKPKPQVVENLTALNTLKAKTIELGQQKVSTQTQAVRPK